MDYRKHKTQLSADEIKIVINKNTKDNGIEVKEIVIDENIAFIGMINNKLKSDFSGEVRIIGIKDNILTLELDDFNITKLSVFKGGINIFIKGLLKKLSSGNITMKGKRIDFNIKELQKNIPRKEVEIDSVYIEDKLLNIEGKEFKVF